MADNTKKAANLTTFALAQDFMRDHWDWEPAELGTLGDPDAMAKVILSRLQGAGLEVTEAYLIKHDKDEHELWNEYENRYQVKFTSNHIHFLCKFAKGKGTTLENIAKIVGVAPNFIAKPKRGKYAYDDMLSYLIHIKYPKKFQYDPHDVITVVGKKDYIEYFRECHRHWMHGRTIRIFADAKVDIKDVERMIIDGEIDQYDLLTDDRYKYLYHLHKKHLDELIATHDLIEGLKTPEALAKLKENRKKK